ncbi:MAG: MFS transporter [Clostridia bacterium]|nr:MFS transporter [Clostridia bacterium]
MTEDTYRGALIGCRFAYAVQAVGNNLTPVLLTVFASLYGVSLAKLSLIITINFIVQIPADMLSVKICNRLGYRAAMLIAQFISLTGLIMMSLLPTATGGHLASLIVSSALVSVGGGLTEVVVSPLTDSLPTGASKSKLALLHSSYCWAACAVIAAASLTLAVTGYSRWYILPLCFTALPIINILVFSIVKMPMCAQPALVSDIRQWGKDKTFYILIAVMFCAGAAEVTVSQWSSLFAEQALSLDKQLGDILGPCAFAASMGIGRLLISVSAGDGGKVMTLAAAGCAVCYVTTALMPLKAMSLAACALCGLTVSVMSPSAYSLASKRLAGGNILLFGILAIAADIGCSAGPAITGLISDAVDGSSLGDICESLGFGTQELAMRVGIAAGAIFPIILLVLSRVLDRRQRADCPLRNMLSHNA